MFSATTDGPGGSGAAGCRARDQLRGCRALKPCSSRPELGLVLHALQVALGHQEKPYLNQTSCRTKTTNIPKMPQVPRAFPPCPALYNLPRCCSGAGNGQGQGAAPQADGAQPCPIREGSAPPPGSFPRAFLWILLFSLPGIADFVHYPGSEQSAAAAVYIAKCC